MRDLHSASSARIATLKIAQHAAEIMGDMYLLLSGGANSHRCLFTSPISAHPRLFIALPLRPYFFFRDVCLHFAYFHVHERDNDDIIAEARSGRQNRLINTTDRGRKMQGIVGIHAPLRLRGLLDAFVVIRESICFVSSGF